MSPTTRDDRDGRSREPRGASGKDARDRPRADGESQDRSRTDGGVAVERGGLVQRGREYLQSPRSEFVQSLPFWVPTTLLMLLFVYGAIGWNFVISLTDWVGLGDPSYAGLDFTTYEQLLADPTFRTAARNTLVLLVAFTVASLVLGLVLAILVDQNIRFENTFRTIYLLPMSLSFVVTALFWSWMYNPSVGLVNVTIRSVGEVLDTIVFFAPVSLEFLTQRWIADPQFKLGAVTFALMWQFSGYCMVVYLAGLRTIPTEHYEAAKVDGASTLRMYWRVVIPQLRTSTMSAAVVLMVFALKAFDFLFVMFGDTPGPSVDILSVMMFREAFSNSRWAYGSAVAMVLFVLALGVISPYLYAQYRRGEL